jgi:hypothetical protein
MRWLSGMRTAFPGDETARRMGCLWLEVAAATQLPDHPRIELLVDVDCDNGFQFAPAGRPGAAFLTAAVMAASICSRVGF